MDSREEEIGCLKGAVMSVGVILAFTGVGWALFRIIEIAGMYIVVLFWIIVAVVIVIKLLGLHSK